MDKIRLKDSLKKLGGTKTWFYDDVWITNGIFAIKREYVKNDYQYLEQENANIEGAVCVDENNLEFYKTHIIIDTSSMYARKFKSDCEQVRYINDKLVQEFKIEIIKGVSMKDDRPLSIRDDEIILMPVLVNDDLKV